MAQIPKTKKTTTLKQSMSWLTNRVLYLSKNQTVPGAIKSGNYTNNNLFGVGDVFIYHYDPKLKDKLPYYDKFPLIIVIGMSKDGFLGLNLHYLPPDIRIAFMDKCTKLAATPLGDNKTRMQISYELLSGSRKYNAFRPCLKKYLIGHVRGKMLRILPHEWQMCILLPVASFSKQSESYVWNESRKMI